MAGIPDLRGLVYILMKEENIEKALSVLQNAGYRIKNTDETEESSC